MRIRWHNVVIVLLVGGIALMALYPHSPVGLFLQSMTHLGAGHSDAEQILGLMAWVLVILLFFVVIRRLTHNRHQ